MRDRLAVASLGSSIAFWWPCIFESDFLTPDRLPQAAQASSAFLQYIFPLVVILLSVVLALVHPRLKATGAPAVIVCIGAVGMAGYLLQASAGMANYAIPDALVASGHLADVFAAGGSLASAFYIIFYLVSAFHLSRVCPLEYLPVLIMASYAGSEALQIVLSLVPQGVQLFFRCACPLLSALLLVLVSSRKLQDTGHAKDVSSSALFGGGLIALSFVLVCFSELFNYAINIAQANTGFYERNVFTPLASLVAAVALVAVLHTCRERQHQGTVVAFVALALVTMAVLLVVFVHPGAQGTLTDRLFVAVGHCLRVLILVELCWGVAHHVIGKEPAAGLYAIVAVGVPLALQNYCAAFLTQNPASTPVLVRVAGVSLFAISLALMVFIALAGRHVARQERREMALNWHVNRCRPVAEQAGFTPKELEVASLIYRGFTLKHISEQLGVSTSTVETHQRHIYKKASVHSRQEFINLVDSQEQVL